MKSPCNLPDHPLSFEEIVSHPGFTIDVAQTHFNVPVCVVEVRDDSAPNGIRFDFLAGPVNGFLSIPISTGGGVLYVSPFPVGDSCSAYPSPNVPASGPVPTPNTSPGIEFPVPGSGEIPTASHTSFLTYVVPMSHEEAADPDCTLDSDAALQMNHSYQPIQHYGIPVDPVYQNYSGFASASNSMESAYYQENKAGTFFAIYKYSYLALRIITWLGLRIRRHDDRNRFHLNKSKIRLISLCCLFISFNTSIHGLIF